MDLWSDYEGKTIADAYPLGRLIRPEGRSAFFTTSNGTGVPAVIRLTESLNDDAEMMERWRQVSALNQEHLITIRKYGQTRFESTPLTYALMEPSDGSLADILKERPLTPTETREIATSLVDALKALHSHNLVHGMIEPSNVMAVGEVVKLRSDCVRECGPDQEFITPEETQALKNQDVTMLSALLLKTLTLTTQMNPAEKLPAPFDRIVANGLDGSWGLAQIDEALNPPAVRPLVPPEVMAAAQIVPRGTISPEPAAAEPVTQIVPRGTISPIPEVPKRPGLSSAWIVGLAFVLILALVGWRALSGNPSAAPAATTPVPAPAAPAVSQSVPIPKTGIAVPDKAPVVAAHTPVATGRTQSGWRVAVFTYRREDQAAAKVALIRGRHPGLSPAVFSPSAGVYLVVLGGPVSEHEAAELKERAIREGMPADTFIRRYGPR